MKKFKKLIAVMLAAVLFTGTCMSDMGIKEVKAEEYCDALTMELSYNGTMEAGQEIEIPITLKNESDLAWTLSELSAWYRVREDEEGEIIGQFKHISDEDESTVTEENIGQIDFRPSDEENGNDVKEFIFMATLPESWDTTSEITFYAEAVGEGTDDKATTGYVIRASEYMEDDGEDWEEDAFVPDDEYGPIDPAFYIEDEEDLYPGNKVTLKLQIGNNTTENATYTADFGYINRDGKHDTDVNIVMTDWDSGEGTPLESISDVTFEPGEYKYFDIKWIVPEDWEENRAQVTVDISNGTDSYNVACPGGSIETYESGDVALKGITIDPQYKEGIQFENGEKIKKIPVEFKVEAKRGWKLDTVDFYYYSQVGSHYLSQDVKQVEQISDTTYRTYIELNKYVRSETFLLESICLTFKKSLEYDTDYDGQVTDEDCETVGISHWAEYYSQFVDDEYVRIPATEEEKVEFYGEDDYWEEIPSFEYAGTADFCVTKSEPDKNNPKIEGIELLTDPSTITSSSSVDVEVNFEEYGSGVKEIDLYWANSDGDWVTSAHWSCDDIESVTGKGSVILSSEEGVCEDDWEETIWENKEEYYVSEVAITDWAGNYVSYNTEGRADCRFLENLTYGYNEETDEEDWMLDEIANVSFSRGGKHSYEPLATKLSERADAAKKKNGKAKKVCLICGKESSSTGTIYYPKYFTIGNGVYTGKETGCGEIVVKDSKKKEVHPAYYFYEFIDDATKVGKHKMKIHFGGNYWGTVTKSYVIVPSAVQDLSAEVSGAYNSVKLSWKPAKGASGYYISWGQTSEDEFGDTYVKKWSSKKSTAKTFYTVTGLSADKLYGFRVVPYYKSGDTKYYESSEYEYAECKTQKNIKAPSSVTATLNGNYNDVSLSWKQSTGADGYNVYYKLGSGNYELLTSTTELKTKEAVGLTDGGKYTFRVAPYYMEDDEMIESANGKTTTVYIMKAPGKAKVTKSSSKVKVAWTNISGESGYEISQSEDPNVDGKITTYKTTSGKSKTISAKKGVTYYYKVRAYKTVGSKKIYGPWTDVTEYTRK